MKNTIGLFGRIGLIATLAAIFSLSTSQAQTSTNAPAAPPLSTGTFFDSVTGYFSSFNPALEDTFTNRGTFWTSVDAMTGGSSPLVNSIGLSYDVWKLVSVEGVFRNSGVAGAIVDAQGGLGLNFKVHDVRLTAYVDGGYGFAETRDKVYAEIGVRVLKALTEHTFAGVGVAAQLPGNRQVLSAFVGFTF